jgi:hypothetical protein
VWLGLLITGLTVACGFLTFLFFRRSRTGADKLRLDQTNTFDQKKSTREILSFLDHSDFVENPPSKPKRSAARPEHELLKTAQHGHRRKAKPTR